MLFLTLHYFERDVAAQSTLDVFVFMLPCLVITTFLISFFLEEDETINKVTKAMIVSLLFAFPFSLLYGAFVHPVAFVAAFVVFLPLALVPR